MEAASRQKEERSPHKQALTNVCDLTCVSIFTLTHIQTNAHITHTHRAGAVEGYVPGTGRASMAANAAVAAARKAAAAGQSAYTAATAAADLAAADPAASQRTEGGEVSQGDDRVSSEQQQQGADASTGRQCSPVPKRVRFAEHSNHKFLFDAKSPCRWV